MPASTTGGKTVTKDVGPGMSGPELTTLLGTAVENLTVDQFRTIAQALKKVPGGHAPERTIGSLLV